MTKQAIASPRLAKPVGPFSPAIRAGGLIYVSGQFGQDPVTGQLVEGGVERQAEQAFANLAAILDAAGASFDDVLRASVYLTSMSDFPALNAIYARYFPAPYPARTTLAVVALPLGAAMEIDVIVQDRAPPA